MFNLPLEATVAEIRDVNYSRNLCLFVPMSFRENHWKLLVLNWRPRRDLNPCYRRERFAG